MRIGAVDGYQSMYPRYDQVNSVQGDENTKAMFGRTEQETPAAKYDPDKQVKSGRRSSPEDCETCKNRKYQDGSDEVNVSFKAASHVSPSAAAGAVRAHEQQHVSNAYKKAAQGDGKVVSANVTIHTAICPECGTSYVSGGTTKTSIMYSKEGNAIPKNDGKGNQIDYQA